MMKDENLKYPIGHFICPEHITEGDIKGWIDDMDTLSQRLQDLLKGFTQNQLDTPYRTGGWTVRQLVHHIADSHHHSYTRFKWALTEEQPLIKAYDEKTWSHLLDAKKAPIELSLNYIQALHYKLVYLLKGLSKEQLVRYYIHPEDNVKVSVAQNIGKYAWHGNHHLAHIQNLKERKCW